MFCDVISHHKIVVLGMTRASRVTMYAHHPVTFHSSHSFFRHFMTFLDVSKENQLQLAQGHNPSPDLVLVLPTIGCCILLLSAQDGLDPQQLALVVFFLPPNSAKTSLALAVDLTCNLRWWCFFLY